MKAGEMPKTPFTSREMLDRWMADRATLILDDDDVNEDSGLVDPVRVDLEGVVHVAETLWRDRVMPGRYTKIDTRCKFTATGRFERTTRSITCLGCIALGPSL